MGGGGQCTPAKARRREASTAAEGPEVEAEPRPLATGAAAAVGEDRFRVRCLQSLISLEPLLILLPHPTNLSPHTLILPPHTCPPNLLKVGR